MTGEFGIVYRGVLTSSDGLPTAVAVKTIKGNTNHVL